MVACSRCGTENREGARFCDSCAASLLAPAPAREQRKVVTVLFCDVTGSTELGEKLDPEALRALLARYFERMRAIVERHGGTVEKFIGDAVMAVFGVPVLHEDDALRAVRAAIEMRDAFPDLGVGGRIGVTTGEVVAGTAERLATGDAVNVAARLEQAAHPGEILIGEETFRLTRDAIDVDALEPRELKGKAKPVAAYRLLAVHGDVGLPRRAGAAMVGRERERRQLASVWERVVSESACQLFTVLGPAGVGKSRLAAEFLATLDDVTVVHGHCLSYGDGITYWPVAEVIRQLPPAEPDPAAAEGTRALLGDRQLVTSSEEFAWAFRKQLETAAAERPLVCVFDDLHWGEATFLDLVEHVADLARDAPILLLCMARPELLDRRTGWGGGKVNATTVLLEPLAPAETELLITALADVDEGLRARILEASEGNPLFVEEIVALLQESGDGEVAIPSTIQVLLAARLDQLDPSERDVLQRGAVEGRIFHRGAVQALSPEGAQVTAQLTALVRKELIRPEEAQLPGEDAFRFRHLLIREAAYDALPKAIRAELHERFGAWLAEHGADLAELDEMLGYHLEQSHRFRQDLGQPGEPLASRAAARLGAAGRRALDRGDMDGASNLLERAAALLEEGNGERLELEVELGEALLERGRLTEAESLLEETVERAMQTTDDLLQARARVGLGSVRVQTQGSWAHEDIERDIEPLVAVLERAEDHRGAADALRLLGLLKRWSGDYEAATELQERALLHARQVGNERREAASIRHIGSIALWGPEHVDLALARCRAILDAASNERVQANCLVRIGGLEGLAGRFAAAWDAIDRARAIMDDLGLRHLRAHSSDVAVLVASLAGDFERAEWEARGAYAVLEEMGDRTFQATQAGLLGEVLVAQGRFEEAEQWLVTLRETRPTGNADQSGLLLAALLAAQRGLLEQAEKLTRASLAQGDESPVPLIVDPRFTLAEILLRSGRAAEAESEAETCLRGYEAKGIVPLAEKARALLVEIRAAGAQRPTGRQRALPD